MEVNSDSGSRGRGSGTPRWIAAGFIFAFSVSVLTVIYTGLMVEGSRAEFDDGFRSVEMRLNERRVLSFFFESETAHPDASLELTLPGILEAGGTGAGAPGRQRLALVPGRNEVEVEIRAVAVGAGYVIARVIGEAPIGRDSVFVTVSGD